MKLNKILSVLLFAAAPVLFINNAHANSTKKANAIKTKSLKYASKASLDASVSTEVQQDRLRLTLGTEVTYRKQQDVAGHLKFAIKETMDILKKNNNDDIEISTGSHHIWSRSNKEGDITTWYGSTDIYLESNDFEAVTKLAQSVKEHMSITSLNFFVSPQSRAKVEEELLIDVAQAFDIRATALTKALGFNNYKIDIVELGGRGAVYRDNTPRIMAMPASSEQEDSMDLESGTQTVSLSISGTIYLLND